MTELSSQDLLARLGYADGFADEPLEIRSETLSVTDGVQVRRLSLETGSRCLPALLLVPEMSPPETGFPGVLYCHAHGNRYDIGKSEVVSGRPALMDPPLGIALAQAGYAVLCADMAGFGERQCEGTESGLAKAALWRGRSLLGDMLRDQALAFRALTSLGEVDSACIAAAGISMGGTLAYFLGAILPEIRRVAHLCVFADLGMLEQAGALDLHGIYMVVPGLLPDHDLPDVAAMIAPRPQLVCYSPRDPLTPDMAIRPALARLRRAYTECSAPEALRVVAHPTAGHSEVPAFRSALLAFLDPRRPDGAACTEKDRSR